jgi:hypothetical protein
MQIISNYLVLLAVPPLVVLEVAQLPGAEDLPM